MHRDYIMMYVNVTLEYHLLNQIYTYTGEIADKCKPGKILKIPSETDFLDTHCYDTRSRADNKHAATHSGAVRK